MFFTRRQWAYVGAILMGIVGLPGLIADTKTWSEWLSSIPIELVTWDYGLVIAGLVMFLYASFPSIRRLFERSDKRDKMQENQKNRLDSAVEPEKIFTQRTVGEIFEATKELTSVDVERYAKPHLGKWIRVQSVIKNISVYNNSEVSIMLGRWFDPRLTVIFNKDKWWSRLETMNNKDRLAVVGKIHKIESHTVILNECEIVDQEDEDDTLRSGTQGLID